jgi:ABC-2 type transport system ATP-binding protein
VNATPIVEVARLRRTFDHGRVVALDDVSFSMAAGEIVAVLGANGAGKTTLIKILSTLLRPSAGIARVAGNDVTIDAPAVRAKISTVLGGERGLYGRLTARDNLRFFGVLKGESPARLRLRTDEILAGVGLAERAGDRVETFSRGMKQRLHLAIGMLGRPQLLMLDEPTIGLDVLEARRIRQTVQMLAHAGTAILLTSHNVRDIDQLASRVLHIRSGVIDSDQPMSQFRRHGAGVARIVVEGLGAAPDAEPLSATLGGRVTVASVNPSQWSAEITVPEWSPRFLIDAGRVLGGHRLLGMRVESVGLDEAVEAVLSGTPS